MKQTTYIIALLLLISCHSEKSKQEANAQDSVKKDSLKSKINYRKTNRWDTLYISENHQFYVMGDSIKKIIYEIFVKFEPHLLFSDFKLDTLFTGVKHSIDFKSNNLGKRFKTRINSTYNSEGVNFAGHYCFVFWGCGSSCQSSIIVDVLTGKIYDGLEAALGYKYEVDSKMIIVNPPDSTGYYSDCFYCKPEIYIWDGKKKSFIKR